MKLFRTIFPFVWFAAFATTGCSDERDTYFPYTNIPLENHAVVLAESDVLDVGIGVPNEHYHVTSDDSEIVQAEIVEGAIRLAAGKIGKTIVRLADDGYNRALMTVEVRKLFDLTLEPVAGETNVLRLDNDGTPKELKILTGNGGYTAVSSAPEAVEAEIVSDTETGGGGKLVLKGKAIAADVTVTVTDAKQKTAVVAVRVTAPVQSVKFDVEGPLSGEYRYNDTPQKISFNITSGNGGYTLVSSNQSVATATIEGTTVTLTVVGDGATTLSVFDNEKESASIDLWVPMNTDDPTPRISWDGYRADLSVPGTANRSIYATLKHMYWDRTNADGQTDTWDISFNGGWKDGLECVNAANRKPTITTIFNGEKTVYDDKSSAVRLTSLLLEKRIGDNGKDPHIYFISFATADGHRGFIVHDWNRQ